MNDRDVSYALPTEALQKTMENSTMKEQETNMNMEQISWTFDRLCVLLQVKLLSLDNHSKISCDQAKKQFQQFRLRHKYHLGWPGTMCSTCHRCLLHVLPAMTHRLQWSRQTCDHSHFDDLVWLRIKRTLSVEAWTGPLWCIRHIIQVQHENRMDGLGYKVQGWIVISNPFGVRIVPGSRVLASTPAWCPSKPVPGEELEVRFLATFVKTIPSVAISNEPSKFSTGIVFSGEEDRIMNICIINGNRFVVAAIRTSKECSLWILVKRTFGIRIYLPAIVIETKKEVLRV